MPEKKIQLTQIDPVDIYGVNDRIINHLCSYFPDLKVVARGNTIKLKGTYRDIDNFENAITALAKIRMSKRHLNTDDVDSLFREGGRNISSLSTKISIDQPQEMTDPGHPEEEMIVTGVGGKAIRAGTKHQKQLLADYYNHDMIFAIGPAGTGKTYTAIALAVRALQRHDVRKLILTRPAVEAGERLGFLPGDLKEKLDPYLRPLYDALGDMIPLQRLKDLITEEIIQIAPLAYMRGRTLDNAFVILDEAQNTSFGQLKMFLTRMGHNSKFIITGDLTQIDLPNKEDSGLAKGIELLRRIKGISIIRFTNEDIVRHPLVTKIVNAFEKG